MCGVYGQGSPRKLRQLSGDRHQVERLQQQLLQEQARCAELDGQLQAERLKAAEASAHQEGAGGEELAQVKSLLDGEPLWLSLPVHTSSL